MYDILKDTRLDMARALLFQKAEIPAFYLPHALFCVLSVRRNQIVEGTVYGYGLRGHRSKQYSPVFIAVTMASKPQNRRRASSVTQALKYASLPC